MLDRAEHLVWCKERALAYVDEGDMSYAVASMMSDLAKHPETRPNDALGLLGLMLAADQDTAAIRQWIEEFR